MLSIDGWATMMDKSSRRVANEKLFVDEFYYFYIKTQSLVGSCQLSRCMSICNAWSTSQLAQRPQVCSAGGLMKGRQNMTRQWSDLSRSVTASDNGVVSSDVMTRSWTWPRWCVTWLTCWCSLQTVIIENVMQPHSITVSQSVSRHVDMDEQSTD